MIEHDDDLIERERQERKPGNGGRMNLAYHFVGETLRDGRPVPKDGEWLEHDGPLEMCVSGLHFSRHPFDALKYAPGETLCLVEVGGKIIEPNDDDKGICSRRRIVKRVDLTENLRYFARMQAMFVIHLYPGEPDDIVLDYLMTGDSAARSAAWNAARSAAWSAAESAQREYFLMLCEEALSCV